MIMQKKLLKSMRNYFLPKISNSKIPLFKLSKSLKYLLHAANVKAILNTHCIGATGRLTQVILDAATVLRKKSMKNNTTTNKIQFCYQLLLNQLVRNIWEKIFSPPVLKLCNHLINLDAMLVVDALNRLGSRDTCAWDAEVSLTTEEITLIYANSVKISI